MHAQRPIGPEQSRQAANQSSCLHLFYPLMQALSLQLRAAEITLVGERPPVDFLAGMRLNVAWLPQSV